MARIEVEIDASALNELAANIEKAKGELTGRLAAAGADLMREEAPFATGNLYQGIAPTKIDTAAGTATITATAKRPSMTAGTGEVYRKGEPAGKRVSLSPQPEFNYAAAVALGRPAITPKPGKKALLIPLPNNVPPLGRYVRIDGRNYIYAKRAKAAAANPFHERAAKRLENDASIIADEVLRKFI